MNDETGNEVDGLDVAPPEHADDHAAEQDQSDSTEGQDNASESAEAADANCNAEATIASPPAWKGKVVRDEIDHRQARRKAIKEEVNRMSPPVLGDAESLKEFAKDFRKKNDEYLSACYLIDYDLNRAKRAARIACETLLLSCEKLAAITDGNVDPVAQEQRTKGIEGLLNQVYAQADEEVPLGDKDRERLEQEQKKKEAATGEVAGQMKLDLKTKVKGDDGSCAEAASECVTKPLDEVEPSNEDEDECNACEAENDQMEQAEDPKQEDAGSAENTSEPAQTAEQLSSTTENKAAGPRTARSQRRRNWSSKPQEATAE